MRFVRVDCQGLEDTADPAQPKKLKTRSSVPRETICETTLNSSINGAVDDRLIAYQLKPLAIGKLIPERIPSLSRAILLGEPDAMVKVVCKS